jgi:hypothetical protein
LVAIGIVVLGYLGIGLLIAYSSSLAVVTTWGRGPAVAATDLEAFKRPIALEAEADFGLAENSFLVPEGTRARVPIWAAGSNFPACRGSHAEQLKLLDGERVGQTVWANWGDVPSFGSAPAEGQAPRAFYWLLGTGYFRQMA